MLYVSEWLLNLSRLLFIYLFILASYKELRFVYEYIWNSVLSGVISYVYLQKEKIQINYFKI